jgi:hypothetical protein
MSSSMTEESVLSGSDNNSVSTLGQSRYRKYVDKLRSSNPEKFEEFKEKRRMYYHERKETKRTASDNRADNTRDDTPPAKRTRGRPRVASASSDVQGNGNDIIQDDHTDVAVSQPHKLPARIDIPDLDPETKMVLAKLTTTERDVAAAAWEVPDFVSPDRFAQSYMRIQLNRIWSNDHGALLAGGDQLIRRVNKVLVKRRVDIDDKKKETVRSQREFLDDIAAYEHQMQAWEKVHEMTCLEQLKQQCDYHRLMAFAMAQQLKSESALQSCHSEYWSDTIDKFVDDVEGSALTSSTEQGNPSAEIVN